MKSSQATLTIYIYSYVSATPHLIFFPPNPYTHRSFSKNLHTQSIHIPEILIKQQFPDP